MTTYSNIGNSLSGTFFPYGEMPPAFESNDNWQPYFREDELRHKPLTSSHDGFVWLTSQDQFYSENFAHTYQSIVTTGTSNSSIVTNVVSNAIQTTSSYAYHVATLLEHRRMAWNFPLVSLTGVP